MTERMPDPPGLDVARLEAYLRREHPELLGTGSLTAQVIAGGRSNLKKQVEGGEQPNVVRRPPGGRLQTTENDMPREHRQLTALAG